MKSDNNNIPKNKQQFRYTTTMLNEARYDQICSHSSKLFHHHLVSFSLGIDLGVGLGF
jgi:hypothetical protein